jgi:hypothetical protein
LVYQHGAAQAHTTTSLAGNEARLAPSADDEDDD